MNQSSFLIQFLLALLLIQCSSCQDDSNNVDPALLITDELRNLIESVWCFGRNYKTLCEGGSNFDYCLGEVFQEDFIRKKNVSVIQVFNKEKLGALLGQINCTKEEDLPNEVHKESDSASIFWIIILCIIVCCGLGFIAYGVLHRHGLCPELTFPNCLGRERTDEREPPNIYF